VNIRTELPGMKVYLTQVIKPRRQSTSGEKLISFFLYTVIKVTVLDSYHI